MKIPRTHVSKHLYNLLSPLLNRMPGTQEDKQNTLNAATITLLVVLTLAGPGTTAPLTALLAVIYAIDVLEEYAERARQTRQQTNQ